LSLIAESPGPVSALSADVEKIYESQEQVIKASFGHQAVKFKVFELKFWENHNFIFYKFRNHNEDIAMSA
jgi:hypothetical protein